MAWDVHVERIMRNRMFLIPWGEYIPNQKGR